MEIYTHMNGPFMVNTYLLIKNDRAIIIDPGLEIYPVLDMIESCRFSLEAIVATHGHIDHIEGVNIVKRRYNIPFYVNNMDNDLVKNARMQARMFGVDDPGEIIPDKNLPANGDIEIAGMILGLLHTPGHSRGSLSLIIEDVIFSGDTLFNYSIGRTDLPGGNYSELILSIHRKLLVFPDETRVLSGHGPETTIGIEKKMNPFLG